MNIKIEIKKKNKVDSQTGFYFFLTFALTLTFARRKEIYE